MGKEDEHGIKERAPRSHDSKENQTPSTNRLVQVEILSDATFDRILISHMTTIN